MFKKYLKKNLSTVIALLSIFIGLVFTYNYANAETLNAGVLEISYAGSGPLFSVSNIAPGYSETKIVTVKNTGTLPHLFSVAVSGTLGPLADVLKIKTQVLGVDVWEKILSDIAKNPDSNVIVGSIAPGGEALVNITATLPEDVGNSYQGTETLAFSFVMGNESTDAQEPTGGGFPSFQDNQDNDGGSSSRSVAVSQSEGDENQQETQEDFFEEINTQENTVPETKGEEESDLINCFWWWLLLIIFAIFLAVYFFITNKIKMVFKWVWPIFGAVVLILIHWGLHDFFEKVKYCDWFWVFELILILLYFLLIWIFPNDTKELETKSKQH